MVEQSKFNPTQGHDLADCIYCLNANSDWGDDPQHVQTHVRAVTDQQSRGQNQKTSKWDEPKCTAQSQTKDPTNRENTDTNQKDFQTVVVRGWRLIFLRQDWPQFWV